MIKTLAEQRVFAYSIAIIYNVFTAGKIDARQVWRAHRGSCGGYPGWR